MNRAEMIRRYLAYKAAVEALHEAIKADGRHEYEENKTAPTYRLGYATASASITRDRAEVTDHDQLVAYLAGRYPTEVETRTVRVVRNPEWLTQLLDRLATAGPEEDGKALVDSEGTVIPGVEFRPGGEFITMGVVPMGGSKRHLLRAAREAAQTGDWGRFEAIVEGRAPIKPAPGDAPEEVATHNGRRVESVEGL